MVKSHNKSWFEIWDAEYINEAVNRLEEDKDLVILQIEHGINYNFIVELIKPKDYRQPMFPMRGEKKC